MKTKKQGFPVVSGKMPRSSVSFPSEIHAHLEKIAKRKKVSVSWVIRDAVEKYIAAEAPLFNRSE